MLLYPACEKRAGPRPPAASAPYQFIPEVHHVYKWFINSVRKSSRLKLTADGGKHALNTAVGWLCCLRFQVSSPECSEDAMAARLASIPLKGQSIEEVEAAVKGAFLEFGVEMRRSDSKKSSKEPGARLKLIGLQCKHGLKNRQKEYREGDGGEVPETWTLPSRMCCARLSRSRMIVGNDSREW